jgi:DNA-binding Lrp family transcriptional regulator
MNLSDRPALDQLLLNDWQRGFPLCDRPYAEVAARCGSHEATVLSTYQGLLREGCISRIGGTWGAGAGGAAMLCALAVPTGRLQAVAEQVNAIDGVNHNYEREHRYNLWFVITDRNKAHMHAQVDRLERATGLMALRLPMVRPYRIDLGFDLRQTTHAAHPGETPSATRRRAPPVAHEDAPLAALVEAGLPLTPAPYEAWARALHWPVARVQASLSNWLAQGSLRRFGVIVRHHDLGIHANAMTVIDVPDDLVDAVGARLAAQAGVTLCYRRERHRDWFYNLYFMVHGHERAQVGQIIEAAIAQAGLQGRARQTLFSGQRFKQTGGRYFSTAAAPTPSTAINPLELDHELMDRLHGGLPLSEHPYADVAADLGLREDEVLLRLQRLLDTGMLTRFGPLFQIERAGGQFLLAALAVPEADFERVAEQVNALSAVAHNYRRTHQLNMWFVVAGESPQQVNEACAQVEALTGLKVYAFPKEREFFVELRLSAQAALHIQQASQPGAVHVAH